MRRNSLITPLWLSSGKGHTITRYAYLSSILQQRLFSTTPAAGGMFFFVSH